MSAALIGILLVIALKQVSIVIPKVSETEVMSMSMRAKVYWVERWAVDGVREPQLSVPLAGEQDGKYASALPDDAADGSVSYRFNEVAWSLAGGVISFRPAFSDGEVPFSVTWLCARAPVPPGFTVRGKDQTDLPASLLIASCRQPEL